MTPLFKLLLFFIYSVTNLEYSKFATCIFGTFLKIDGTHRCYCSSCYNGLGSTKKLYGFGLHNCVDRICFVHSIGDFISVIVWCNIHNYRAEIARLTKKYYSLPLQFLWGFIKSCCLLMPFNYFDYSNNWAEILVLFNHIATVFLPTIVAPLWKVITILIINQHQETRKGGYVFNMGIPVNRSNCFRDSLFMM
jgi:hypothetical protein